MISKAPHLNSKSIFEAANLFGISKSVRCKTLKKVAKMRSPIKKPPLSIMHKEKWLEWAQTYLKTNFNNVFFTDECRATLDGPDYWSSGWVLNNREPSERKIRQQGGGSVMFWAGIINNIIIGPILIPSGTKSIRKFIGSF